MEYAEKYFKDLGLLKKLFISHGIRLWIKYYKDRDDPFTKHYLKKSQNPDKEVLMKFCTDKISRGIDFLAKEGEFKEKNMPTWKLISHGIKDTDPKDWRGGIDFWLLDIYKIGTEYFLQNRGDIGDPFIDFMFKGLSEMNTMKPYIWGLAGIVKTLNTLGSIPDMFPEDEDEEESDILHCSECGYEITEKTKFCPKCGIEFE